MEKKKRIRYYDYNLLFAVIMLFVIGLLMIYSSSQYNLMIAGKGSDYYFKRQAFIGLAGLIIAIIISNINYRIFKPLATPAYILSIVLLLATLIMGLASHGAKRWLSIGGISFQPTEASKLALIVFLSALVVKLKSGINDPKNIRLVIALAAVPTLLILKENLSSGIIMAGITFGILFIACRKIKWFIATGIAAVVALIAAKPLTVYCITKFSLQTPESYHLRRVFGWAMPDRYPNDAFQTLQGLYAMGSGGLTGKGLGESIQKFGYLPEAQNDMIFAIICEELGFVGAGAIVCLFLFIVIRLFLIAVNSKDAFGFFLCTGILAHISIQVILNLAVVTAVIPNTGVTLPFISYGGTAIAFTMIEIGIALSVSHGIRIE